MLLVGGSARSLVIQGDLGLRASPSTFTGENARPHSSERHVVLTIGTSSARREGEKRKQMGRQGASRHAVAVYLYMGSGAGLVGFFFPENKIGRENAFAYLTRSVGNLFLLKTCFISSWDKKKNK